MADKKTAHPLAIEMMMNDHRKVEDLFAEYEAEKEGDEDVKRGLAQQVCTELAIHAQVEEELFYPWLRDNLDEEDLELAEEAEVEHACARELMSQIEGAEEIDATYDAKVKVLSEYVKHHVKEEEEEIFPEVADMKEELDALGREMTARKAELAAEKGAAQPKKGKSNAGQRPAR